MAEGMSGVNQHVLDSGHWAISQRIASPERRTGLDLGHRREPETTSRDTVRRAVEVDIIPRLVLGQRQEAAGPAPGGGLPDGAQILRFAELLLAHRDETAAVTYVAAFRAQGHSVEQVYLDLFQPAARRIGEFWADDLCTFVDVTLALGTLHRMLRDFSPDFQNDARRFDAGRQALLVPLPGDQHTFGLSMVAEFFRRSAWTVWTAPLATNLDLARAMRDTWFTVVGFSVSLVGQLEQLAGVIDTVRRESCNAAVGVLVGGPLFVDHPEYVARVGADAVGQDARQAVFHAECFAARIADDERQGEDDVTTGAPSPRSRSLAVKHFSAPTQSLGHIDAVAAGMLIAAASDISLVVDGDGIIRDMACSSDELSADLLGHGDWIGRPWTETVTAESRSKIDALLKDAVADGGGKSRQVNHMSSRKSDVPVLYSAILAGGQGRVVAFGRNLQPFSQMQRRLVEAQQSMERDYSRLRHVETRYRLLFRVSSEPVLIVDVATQTVVEANPAAVEMFGAAMPAILGKPLVEAFDPPSSAPLRALLSVVQTAGRADDVRATLREGGEDMLVSAFIFRQESTSLFLVRLSRMKSDPPVGVIPKMTWKLLKLVENAPDGFVVSDADGLILSANAAFLDMAQVATDRQALGQTLDRWLGRPGVDLDVLIANLRQHGTVRLFASSLQGDLGGKVEVEISAAAVMNSERPCFGFAIRNVGRRLKGEARSGPPLPRSVAQLTELVGRVSLKELVREATDVIEKLSIEAALQMTEGNRASAADLLGLSRQSLYVKLRRYGLVDPAADGNGEGSAGP